jgi:ribosome biogenesis GTPase A
MEHAITQELAEIFPGGVQWFPGHMAKTKRELSQLLKLVNVVIEVADARAPYSTRQRDLPSLTKGKKRILVLSKSDLADAGNNTRWLNALRQSGQQVFMVDATRRVGISALLRHLGKTKGVRALVAGVPNTGKSTLINSACRRAATRTGAIPGITRNVQWLQAAPGVEFLDSPGLLWPKIDDLLQGLKLIWIGSIGANAYPPLEAGLALALYLNHFYPDMLTGRYGSMVANSKPHAVLETIGRQRGALAAGGVVDLNQAATILLTEMRQGRLGRITLDEPPGKAVIL